MKIKNKDILIDELKEKGFILERGYKGNTDINKIDVDNLSRIETGCNSKIVYSDDNLDGNKIVPYSFVCFITKDDKVSVLYNRNTTTEFTISEHIE